MRFDKSVNGSLSYPVTQDMIDNIPSKLESVSVIASNNDRVVIDPSTIQPPTYTDSSDFWNELCDVSKLVYLGKNNIKVGKTKDVIKRDSISSIVDLESDFCSRTLQKYYNVKTYNDGAQLVRADHPLHILSSLTENLLKSNARMRNILPSVNFNRFTDSVVLSAHIIGWAVHTVSPSAFACKWYYGRPRPEEVIYSWANGGITPPSNVENILETFVDKDSVRSNMHSYTLYNEGCPNHPAYPAMHGAAAGAGLLLPVIFDLFEAEEEEVRRTVLNIALFRDVAGVHYETDSLMGISLGEQVLEQKLPGFLESYGANRSEIESLIQEKKRTWI
jgi:hypothetical protein